MTDLYAHPSGGRGRFRPFANLQCGNWIIRLSVRGVNGEHLLLLLSRVTITHGMISNNAILSPSIRKKYRRSTGLPGKFPVSRLVTTVTPSFCSQATGSLVYWYFTEASCFHFLIASRPL